MRSRSICCHNLDCHAIPYTYNKWLASIRTSAHNREISNCMLTIKRHTDAFISSTIPRYFVSLSNCSRKYRFKLPHIHAVHGGKRDGTLFNKHSFHRIASIERPILHIVRRSFVILVPIGLHAATRHIHRLPFSWLAVLHGLNLNGFTGSSVGEAELLCFGFSSIDILLGSYMHIFGGGGRHTELTYIVLLTNTSRLTINSTLITFAC